MSHGYRCTRRLQAAQSKRWWEIHNWFGGQLGDAEAFYGLPHDQDRDWWWFVTHAAELPRLRTKHLRHQHQDRTKSAEYYTNHPYNSEEGT